MPNAPKSTRDLLNQIVANQEVILVTVGNLKREFATLQAESRSNYVGFEGWVREIISQKTAQ